MLLRRTDLKRITRMMTQCGRGMCSYEEKKRNQLKSKQFRKASRILPFYGMMASALGFAGFYQLIPFPILAGMMHYNLKIE